MTYKLLGADGKEYGPVTREQIGDWIREGRANGDTQILAEGGAAWMPLRSFPELVELLPGQGTLPPSLGGIPGPALAPGDYVVDIGLCLSRSWNLFKTHPGLLVGATGLVILMMAAVEYLTGQVIPSPVINPRNFRITPGMVNGYILQSLPGMIIYPLLYSGLYGLVLKLIRGQPAAIGDAFMGFQVQPLQIIITSVLVSILTGIGVLLCVIPGIYLSIAWIFAIPLVLDRRLSAWEAMELSRKTVTKHWWIVFCLLVVIGLLVCAGFVACCVGLLVAIPVAIGMMMYAYEDIFSSTH